MPASSTRRRAGALGAVLAFLALAAPLVLLVHGSGPADSDTAPAVHAVPQAGRLSAACVRSAHDAQQLAAQYAAASPGQTVCLTSGDYGKFIAGRKPGMVGIRGRHGARVRMAIDFDSVENLRIDGVTITHMLMRGTSRHITIANSRFTGLAVVLTDQMAHAGIVFDHNVHANIDTCLSCYQGRLHIEGTSHDPAGVVVEHSVFSGGDSDGVRADAGGIKIIDNEFYGFRDRDPFHTDPIQIYGGTNVLIRGNYFHDNAVSAQIMMADGGYHNVVEDNVISGGGYTWAMTWFSDVGSVIRHNTFDDSGQCANNTRCGMLNLGAKAQDRAGYGTIIRDNVLGGISNHGEAKTSRFAASHNLTALPTPGARNMTGLPQFRGPLGRYSGYRLAPGSRGAGRGTGGTDPGIR